MSQTKITFKIIFTTFSGWEGFNKIDKDEGFNTFPRCYFPLVCGN